MKITRKNLKLLIESYLIEGDVTEVLAKKIHEQITNSNLDDNSKTSLKNIVTGIEATSGIDLAELLTHEKVLNFLSKFGKVSFIATAGPVFLSFMYVAGVFTSLPTMINKSINALNTVPGKLRNFKKIKGKPVDLSMLSDNPGDDIYSEINKSFGLKTISKKDMIDFLAIGIGLKNKEGKNVNPLETLRKDNIITEDFYNTVLKRYYELRKEKSIDNVKKEILETISAALEDTKEDTELSLKNFIEITASVI